MKNSTTAFLKIATIYLSLIFLASTLVSCEEKEPADNINPYNIKTIEFEGCEYVIIDAFEQKPANAMAHKGNCKNHNYLDGRSFKDKVKALKTEETINLLIKSVDANLN